MAPRRYSRHSLSYSVKEGEVRVLYGVRPFAFRDRPDNAVHVVTEGDTLGSLAGKYFTGVPRASGLWWVLADFNGLHDPTLALVPGAELVVPSLRTVLEECFSEARRVAL